MRYLLILFFGLLANSIFAQTLLEGYLKGVDEEPVAFASISNKSGKYGVISNIHGCFYLDQELFKDSVLVISCIGFQTQEIQLSRFVQYPIIVLEKKNYSIEEISIVSQKRKLIKVKDKGKVDATYKGAAGAEVITLVKGPADKTLNEITFFCRKQVEKAYVGIRIYAVNSLNQPGENLLQSEIVVPIKKGDTNITYNLINENILIPKKGLFVGIQFMGNPNVIDEQDCKKCNKFGPYVFYSNQFDEIRTYRTFFHNSFVKEKYPWKNTYLNLMCSYSYFN